MISTDDCLSTTDFVISIHIQSLADKLKKRN